MPAFVYKFNTKIGEQTGEVEADSLAQAEAIIKKL